MSNRLYNRNSTYCTLGYQAHVQDAFSNASNGYLVAEFYNESDCSVLSFVQAWPLSSGGYCRNVPEKYLTFGLVYEYDTVAADRSSGSIEYFYDDTCSTAERYRSVSLDINVCTPIKVQHGTTDNAYVIFSNGVSTSSSSSPSGGSGIGSADSHSQALSSSSSSAATSSSRDPITRGSTDTTTSVVPAPTSGLSTVAIVGIIAGCVVALLVVLVFIFRRKQVKTKNGSRDDTYSHQASPTYNPQGTVSNSPDGAPRGQIGLWDDDVITAARIPRDKVHVQKLLRRGAYGEVYCGVFNGEQVAVKMLPPETKKSIPHVNEFLAEVKMTALMDHPRIVIFVGVAWDSLADLCVLLEFMEGGDLRTLLDKYESTHYPVGFDHRKITIALHVCHALTYMHSLSPAVIHRDLKSRNILLNRDLDAKLTDFGISRERLDQTMTANKATSLWMAPEVMIGDKYDEKADMFSFGVVLSELDVHSLPYAKAKERTSAGSGGSQMADTVLLQKVAMGKLRVEFSEASPQSVVDLGHACVSVDPRQRPTAAEALYKLQVILQELK
ncbi:hypothetical protein BBJ28_00019184 [Nothophytophthora sp. Chile5]|nr:hypothetical protein BBJ28_00019184 [Nothophytophthora sp. Chile5]